MGKLKFLDPKLIEQMCGQPPQPCDQEKWEAEVEEARYLLEIFKNYDVLHFMIYKKRVDGLSINRISEMFGMSRKRVKKMLESMFKAI